MLFGRTPMEISDLGRMEGLKARLREMVGFIWSSLILSST